jgi:hypothetical protein
MRLPRMVAVGVPHSLCMALRSSWIQGAASSSVGFIGGGVGRRASGPRPAEGGGHFPQHFPRCCDASGRSAAALAGRGRR